MQLPVFLVSERPTVDHVVVKCLIPLHVVIYPLEASGVSLVDVANRCHVSRAALRWSCRMHRLREGKKLLRNLLCLHELFFGAPIIS